MRAYLVKRISLFFPTLVLLTVIVFIVLRVVPGDPAVLILGGDDGEDNYTAEELAALQRTLGTDRSIYVQYADWAASMVIMDFGDSYFYEAPVTEHLSQRLPITLQLTFMAMVISGIIAIPLGIFSAVRQDTWGDYASRFLTLVGLATPNFFVGMIMIFALVLLVGWVPPLGYANLWENPWTNLQQQIFPALALGTSGMAFLARVTRSAMLDILHEDYIRTARAKGLGERNVIMRHGLRNAILPVVTIFGLGLANAASGSVVVEVIFGLPGMGRLLIEGVQRRDFPMVQSVVVLLGVMVLVANLVTDIAYAWLNPRIRYT